VGWSQTGKYVEGRRVYTFHFAKGQHKCAVVADEFASLTWLNYDTLLATGRSNKINMLIAIQSDNQLKLNYGREWAGIITSICGNIIIGQQND